MPLFKVIGNDNSQPDGVKLGPIATSKVATHGGTPVVQRAGTAGSQAIIGARTYAAPVVTATTGVDAAVIDSIRTQLIALAADVVTHKTLANELRASLIALGPITGAD